jgi:hypothetical protein
MDGVLRLTRILLVAPATFRWGWPGPRPRSASGRYYCPFIIEVEQKFVICSRKMESRRAEILKDRRTRAATIANVNNHRPEETDTKTD